MFALGVLGNLYALDLEVVKETVAAIFAGKSDTIIAANLALVESGYGYAEAHVPFSFHLAPQTIEGPMVAMNGNTALALGAIAAGFKLCSMYPITPATSVSQTLSEIFEELGGTVHQAEDEIAAIGVAIGASYAGVPAITVTSGPGMALKTEFIGAAAMTETPLVIVDVQRGGPSTGMPTKIEQSDLLAALFGTPGDAPKVILAPSTIRECFDVLITARKIAEDFRMVVIVLSDANLATGQQVFPRPAATEASLAPPLDLRPVRPDALPFDWDEHTGLSRRIIPGSPGGARVTTTLNHGADGKAVYDEGSNQRAHRMRSRKLASLRRTLAPPPVHGAQEGELLLVGWGSTRGAIEEAVDLARNEGRTVSALRLKFLNPLPPGLTAIFSRFRKVLTVELNYSDDPDDPFVTPEDRRYSQLALLLRAQTLRDVGCFSLVPGRPFMPREVLDLIHRELNASGEEAAGRPEAQTPPRASPPPAAPVQEAESGLRG